MIGPSIWMKAGGQSLSITVQNIGGQSSNSSIDGALIYSIGEMSSIQNFISANNFQLSTGFLQSFIPLVTGINDFLSIPTNAISISPNPASRYIQVQANFTQTGTLQFSLIDMHSKTISQILPVRINGTYQKRLDLDQYTSGLYYLKIRFQPSRGPVQQSVYKIIKL